MPLRVCSSRRVYLSRDHQSWGRRECDLDSFVQISRNASCGLIMSVSSRLWRRPSLSLSLFHAWHSWTKSNSKRVKPILPSVVSFQWSFFKWLHWLKTRLSWNVVMKRKEVCSHHFLNLWWFACLRILNREMMMTRLVIIRIIPFWFKCERMTYRPHR